MYVRVRALPIHPSLYLHITIHPSTTPRAVRGEIKSDTITGCRWQATLAIPYGQESREKWKMFMNGWNGFQHIAQHYLLVFVIITDYSPQWLETPKTPFSDTGCLNYPSKISRKWNLGTGIHLLVTCGPSQKSCFYSMLPSGIKNTAILVFEFILCFMV